MVRPEGSLSAARPQNRKKKNKKKTKWRATSPSTDGSGGVIGLLRNSISVHFG